MDEWAQQIDAAGVVPVVVVDSLDHALPLADALVEGGLQVIEITLRTPVALDAIRMISDERPEMLVGAGTVLSPDDVQCCREAGARFALAPGLNESVVSEAAEQGLPFIPGVVTPSEIERAMGMGCRCLKYFPAEQTGGVGTLKAMVGPYRHLEPKFIPTGGISPALLGGYLALDEVLAVGGSFLATRRDLLNRDWQQIAKRVEMTVQAIKSIRSTSTVVSQN